MTLTTTKHSTLISASLLGALFVTFILAYFPVWQRLVLAWYNSDDYSHGFFIIPICIYIIWQKWDTLKETEVRPSRWGLVIVIFFLFIYIIAHLAEIVTVASLSMVLLVSGAVIYIYGFRIFKELLFPIAMLLFMIPVPAQIYSVLTMPLQLLVSKISVLAAQILGMPIYREGNIIHLPDRTLQVVQACSGLRSMTALLALSAVFGYFTLKSNTLRTILIVSGVPAAIVVNIFRVLIMVSAFHYFNYDLTKGNVHTAFGVFIFIIALFIIAATRKLLSLLDKPAI